MLKLLLYSVIQSILLAGGQLFLKVSLAKMPHPEWSGKFVISVALNWQFAVSGILFGAGSLLWMYILKHFPLSMAYPMISMSYVFGMIGAVVFFNETITAMRWIGVLFIILGCCFVAR